MRLVHPFWRDAVGAMPLVQALRRLRGARRHRGAWLLVGILALYALIAVATPLVPALQRELIACYHFRPSSFATWAVLQPAPKMYGFANRAFIGTREITPERFDAASFWVNHYPARMARFDGERARVFAQPGATRVITLRSDYRGQREWTVIKATERDGALVLEVAP